MTRSQLQPGDPIVVRPQELVPADAVLLEGPGSVDYAFATGEQTPVMVRAGDTVHARGRVAGAPLRLRVTRAVSHSHLAGLWANPVLRAPKPTRMTEVADRRVVVAGRVDEHTRGDRHRLHRAGVRRGRRRLARPPTGAAPRAPRERTHRVVRPVAGRHNHARTMKGRTRFRTASLARRDDMRQRLLAGSRDPSPAEQWVCPDGTARTAGNPAPRPYVCEDLREACGKVPAHRRNDGRLPRFVAGPAGVAYANDGRQIFHPAILHPHPEAS